MVLDVDFVNFAIFVAALGDRGRMAARDGFDLAQQAVEDIAPMGEHIEDETAACHLAVVPTRPLRWIQLAVEHPPAEIQPDRKNPAKEIGIIKLPELSQPGQEQFILDDAALETGMLGLPRQSQRRGQGLGNRLFEIDVLTGVDRCAGALRPSAGSACIKIDCDVGIGDDRIALGAPL